MNRQDTRRGPNERTSARNVLFTPAGQDGAKKASGLDDLTPEARAKLEQSLKQMRDNGLLEDKNQDGIPDHFELPLRMAGWVGKLIGNPQLGDNIRQQMKALGVTAEQATRRPTSARPVTTSATSTPRHRAQKASTPTSSAVVQRQRAGVQVAASSAVQRSSREPGADSRLGEFLRKLAIVSAVVFGLYWLAGLFNA